MKALRGTLTFVLGIIIGIILFVLAIGGTIVAIGTAVTLGDLQNKLGYDIIDENSDAYNQTLLDTVKSLVDDVKNIKSMSLQELKDAYGINLPEEISGINISKIYEYPIGEIADHVDDILDSIKFGDILETAGITSDIPIIEENKEVGAKTAINNILAAINGDDLSLQDINAKFGISLGVEDNVLLEKLQYISLNEIGDTINYIRLNDLLKANTNTYVTTESNVYINVDKYEEISKSDLKNTSYSPEKGIETYVYGLKDSDNDGEKDSLAERELRYVKNSNDEYIVDNSSYDAGFDADESTTTYYRHIEYKLRNGETGVDYYVESFANTIDIASMNLVSKGFLKVENTTIATFSTPLSNKITATPVSNPYYTLTAPITKDSKLEEVASLDAFVLISEGTASTAIQSFAYKTLNDLQSDDTFIDTLTLGEVITVNSSSSKIIQTLKDTALSDLSSKIDTLCLYQIMDIEEDNFTLSASGNYVKEDANGSYYYRLYNPAIDSESVQKYTKVKNENASSKVLQRLRTAQINTFSDDFKELVLSDVLDITPAIYKKATYASKSELSTGIDYYYYDSDSCLYLLADDEYIDDYFDNNTEPIELYLVSKLGDGNKLIQRLAYVKVDDLSTSLETIIDDTYISDIIEIVDNYAIEASTSTPTDDDENFIIEGNEGGTVYIYDADGQYVTRTYSIQSIDTSTLTVSSSKTLTFKSVADREEAVDKAKDDVLFYSNDDGATFIYNPQLTTYILGKSTTLSATDQAKLYYATDSTAGPITKEYNIYSDSDLYIEYFGQYVQYDSTKISHIVQTTLYKKVGGKTFVNINDPLPSNDPGYAYNDSTDQLFSRVYCETIYVQSTTGTYVLYDNKYVTYDSLNAAHANLTRYNKTYGYIATTLEAYEKTAELTYQTELDNVKKATIIAEKSSNLLIALKNSKTTMKNMGEVTDTLKLKDVMDVTPDSIFAIEYTNSKGVKTTLKECGIDELSSELSSFLSTLTVGDLLNVANITTVKPAVKTMLKDLNLKQFFESLTYNAGIGIVVDLEKIYG